MKNLDKTQKLRDYIKKAIKTHKYILSTTPYATTVIKINSKKHPIITHSTTRTKKYNSVVYNNNNYEYGAYNGRGSYVTRTAEMDEDIEVKDNITTEWVDLSDNLTNKLDNYDDYQGGGIDIFVSSVSDLLSRVENIYKTTDFTVELTLWDDGTYKFRFLRRIGLDKANELLNTPINVDDKIYDVLIYKWGEETISHRVYVGNIPNNTMKCRYPVNDIEFKMAVDYIKEFKTKNKLLNT